ncbi:MAG: inositol monophosphatase [Planctomycetota bacterium]
METARDALYGEVLAFLVDSGRRIRKRAGRIADIGVAKRYLTEEDLRIEHELAALIARLAPDDALYAEEAHDDFPPGRDVWVADPISGTRTFLQGLPQYAIVAAHLHDRAPRFAAVYDPTMDELFQARAGAGATRNDRPIRVATHREGRRSRVLFNLAYGEPDTADARRLFGALSIFDLYRNTSSFALNYCHVACGRYDGFVTVARDSFPEMASALIVREAGGQFTTLAGAAEIGPRDREFLGGSPIVVERLRAAVRAVRA